MRGMLLHLQRTSTIHRPHPNPPLGGEGKMPPPTAGAKLRKGYKNTNALHPILVWGGIKAFAFSKEKELFFLYLQVF